MDAFLCEGGMIDKLYVVDAAPGRMLSVQDLEKEGQFPLVGLEETYRARLTWNSSRQEWIASGPDSEARVWLRQMVAGLENMGTYRGNDNWDVQLAYLAST